MIGAGVAWILAAFGLWALQPWARLFALIIAGFSLFEAVLAFFQFPGTGIGFSMAILPAGMAVTIHGTIDDRFAQRTIRTVAADVRTTGTAALPVPLGTTTGAADEALEGRRVAVVGPMTDGPDALTDGTAVTVDNGSGALRVIVVPTALGGAIGDEVLRRRQHRAAGAELSRRILRRRR